MYFTFELKSTSTLPLPSYSAALIFGAAKAGTAAINIQTMTIAVQIIFLIAVPVFVFFILFSSSYDKFVFAAMTSC